MSYISLSYVDLMLASLLIFINGALSVAFKLGIERHLAINALRMVAQLSAIGFVLKFIFAQTSPLWTLALAVVMVGFAGAAKLERASPARFLAGGHMVWEQRPC